MRACSWCGGPMDGRAHRSTCSAACRTAKRRGSPRLTLHRGEGRSPDLAAQLVDVGTFARCIMCATGMHGRRAHVRTCSARCRTALARGAAPLSLAVVCEASITCCGVRLLWVFRRPGSMGIAWCPSCGLDRAVYVNPRPWETYTEPAPVAADLENLDAMTEAQLLDVLGHECADEDEAPESVTRDTLWGGA